MNARTDFADEINSSSNDFKIKKTKGKYVNVATVDILNDKNDYNKEKGKYISLEFIGLEDQKYRDSISKKLIDSLNSLYEIKKNDKILIVGLGNDKISADSLGPKVADKIMVTNHLFKMFYNQIDKNARRVCVFTPKVMGQTGLESADLISAINELYKPNLVILIDALATSSIKRINKVIQLSNTGITPGSGVGNYRKEITKKTLNTTIISIGVATVVEAKKIIKELNIDIKIDDDEAYNLVLTPKEIDEDIEHLSSLIATSLNKYIQNNLSEL